MGLPDFLKGEFKENTSSEFSEAMERYRKHFGARVSTAELVMSREEIVDMINECIATETTWQEYLGHPGYDDDTDY